MASTERLEIALENVRGSAAALARLAGIWPTARATSLWWDDYSKVFATAQYTAAYDALFGTHRLVRLLSSRRSLGSKLRGVVRHVSPRRWHGPFPVEAPLPHDAILLPPRPSRRGIVAASYHARVVLKVSDVSGITKEREYIGIARAAAIHRHVPMLIDHGVLDGDQGWIAMEFVPNTNPLDRPLNPLVNPRRVWIQWLRTTILPTLERFYEAAGVETVSVDELLSATTARLQRDDMPHRLANVVELARRAAMKSERATAIVTALHRDLGPGHVRRHADNWWIIDWGSMGRGLTCKEVFRRYFWTVSGDEDHEAFWAWLRGDLAARATPVNLRSEIEAYLDWYGTWRKTTMDPESLRCQLLITILDDMHEVVIGFDLRGDLETRLRDVENVANLPRRVRTLAAQLRALGAW